MNYLRKNKKTTPGVAQVRNPGSGNGGGFTLIELLVTMAILGVLATVISSGYTSSRTRGRDITRKSDLKQIATGLETFFNDYGKYPDSDASGQILGCPYTPSPGVGTACVWSVKPAFTDGKTIYFTNLPKDPVAAQSYFYRSFDTGKKFQLFAKLENPKDPDCTLPDCGTITIAGVTLNCGVSSPCNFATTSSNTNTLE